MSQAFRARPGRSWAGLQNRKRRVQLPFAPPIGSSGSNGQAPDFYSGLCVWDIGSSSPFQGDDVGSIPTARTSCSLPLMAGDLTFNQATTDRNRQGAPPT